MRSEHPHRVVITGASAGLGRALALEYAAPGVVLGLTGRDRERLEQCADVCRLRGAVVATACIDVRDRGSIERWLNEFDVLHPVDLLIVNAGVASTLSSMHDWEGTDRIESIVDTNFYGAIYTALPVIERMRMRKSGHVALVSSLAALRGMAISPAYCASKAALKAYGDSVRPLLARDSLTLSIVLPGFVKTAMSDAFSGNRRCMWSADRAARHIRRKLDDKRAEIAFPGLLATGMRFLSLLPARVADRILERLSYMPCEER